MNKTPLKNAIAAFFIALATIAVGGQQALAAETAVYEPEFVYLSPEKESPMPFTGLSLEWEQDVPEGTSANIFTRFYTAEGWSTWNDMHPDIDGDINLSNPKAFISTDLATKFQYKVILQSQIETLTPTVKNLTFTYIHADGSTSTDTSAATGVARETETVSASFQSADTSFSASTSTKPALRVISRSEWGADESLRVYKGDNPEPELVSLGDDFYEKYADELKLSKTVAYNENGELLTWPLEYPEKVTKFFIHHTATSKNLDNPQQAIRDIYYWHAISRGWGDIGYNYIIDQRGNIYEGRYGGDGVIGAHAGPGNNGSIGIAVLGNYEESEVPAPVIESISALIKAKSAKYGIDTMGSSMFRGEMRPNIMGHRDIMSTTCPGSNLYAMLPTIKALSKNAFTVTTIDKRREDQKEAYNYELASNMGMLEMEGGEKSTLSLEVTNTGTATWSADTYFMLSTTKTTEKYLSSAKETWKSETAGQAVAPGETATFHIALTASHLGGFGTFEVFPMINGTLKVEKYLSIPVQNNGSYFDYNLVDLDIPEDTLKPGEPMTVTIKMENTGDSVWRNSGTNRVMLGTENPRDHVSRILAEPSNRLALMEEEEVAPGETATFKVNILAPVRDGLYREYFAPVIEGITWLPHRDNYIEFTVENVSSNARYLGGRFMLESFQPGERKTVELQFENTGKDNWLQDGDAPFTANITKNAQLIVNSIRLKETEVQPDQTGTLRMSVQAPNREGVFRVIVTPKIGTKELTLRPIPLYVLVGRGLESAANQTSESQTQTEVTDGFGNDSNLNPEPVDSELVSAAGTPIASHDNIRIGLSFHGDPLISASGSFVLKDGATTKKTYNADQLVGVTYTNGTYMATGGGESITLSTPPRFEPAEAGSIMRIDNYENRPSWKPELNDNTFRGALEVNWYGDELVVVNELPLEQYLRGLAEIDPNQHFEKIKAIMVLARSYAKYYMTLDEKFPGAPYHLTDDPQRSQYYRGYGFEIRNPTGAKAVEATANEVVTYNGNVIKTPYFSSSDGRTRSAFEVWGWTNAPYLISVDDPGCEGQELRGHGVGLSGCGSLYFAEQGWGYHDIIKYYYQGVEVETRP
ncbi:SpoIID/LytB domain-containing protein [Candidatus Peregrinibacteria bacterium]|nr:SpoIID/LytB domain-containing protein [Candidatus Peregrinibacteria bacterium]